MRNRDNAAYFKFTAPARIERELHTLTGLLHGMGADGIASPAELHHLEDWLTSNRDLATRHPFSEIFPALEAALSDGLFDDEEQQDVIWLCERFTDENPRFDVLTADMQKLQGVVGGIVADKQISVRELDWLRGWMDANSQLRCCWPYDELDSLLSAVLADGQIDDEEHKMLLAFCGDFVRDSSHRAVSNEAVSEEAGVLGVCAMCPEISFSGKKFCFTGTSKKCSRVHFVELIERAGGVFSKNVTRDLDYLVIGADGNPCWAFSCYGRKVEAAVNARKDGSRLLIVHENDFWDSVADAGLPYTPNAPSQ